MRYSLRTLLILTALLPPALAALWFTPPIILLAVCACGAIAFFTLLYLWSAIRRS
jgi:hypothetical protein